MQNNKGICSEPRKTKSSEKPSGTNFLHSLERPPPHAFEFPVYKKLVT